ncbi:MAG TPA: bifunctional 5,10-methylenetetrahydrofolate dehydrogenase/5,10-methenyltetrahydrofolate cyclohydrolase [Candidatus Cloacimonadota bacterium]|nr:bifunctional 5,10-methylenetetrahydrofolate dehydrogenase/5,10-methenyltetrahydrofolate cyclohydrolase [Candidatus Cloacimonadota bacterium]
MTQELSGKPIAIALNKLAKQLIEEHQLKPVMILIQAGSDPASSYYVQSIVKSGAKLGCEVRLHTLPSEITEEEFLRYIDQANQDDTIHGIMIQKPLPAHINDTLVNTRINPDKDIDALHPVNLGRILQENEGFLPCTPAAVYYTMQYYGIDPAQGNVVILGRSNVVGKPLANMLLWKRKHANATVTVCHSRTRNLAAITAQADVLISAIGKAEFVKADMIKSGAIILDVGINEVIDSTGNPAYVGDVDYQACYAKSKAITPVPGGIGRITTSVLFLNLLKAALLSTNVNKSVDEYIDLILDENK